MIALRLPGRAPDRCTERVLRTEFAVRPGTIGDARAALEIERLAFRRAPDRFSLRQIRGLITNPRARVGVAEIDGRIVGWFAALIRTHERWRSGRVYSIAVTPGMTGRGFGRALLNSCLDALEQEGIARVYLEVHEANRAAINLYRSAGFTPLQRLPAYYGPGHHGLRMRRVVETPGARIG